MRAFAVTVAAAVAGCALVIDLGDEPKLVPLDAGTPSGPPDGGSSGAPDVDVPDTGPVFECGLAPSTNANCAACIKERCCDVSKTCAATPRCVQGLDCIKHCLVQTGCVTKCLNDFPEVSDEATCSAFQCAQCTPGPECTRLGTCVFDLPSTSLLRLAEEGRILDLDEGVCKAARQQVAASGDSDAGACFAE